MQAENAVLASMVGDDYFVLPVGVDAAPLAGQDSADVDAAEFDRLAVSGGVHAVSGLIFVCGLFPPASAAYLELPVSAAVASPHSELRK